MNLEEKINQAVKEAMLAKDKARLEALRGIKSIILLAKTDKSGGVITPEMEIQMLQKLIKQRKESAEIYNSQNRVAQYEEEMFQAQVISEFLPKQLSEEELVNMIQSIIKEIGASSVKDMGKVMAAANAKIQGRAESKLIAEIVKKNLA